jgi:hypothetical protein
MQWAGGNVFVVQRHRLSKTLTAATFPTSTTLQQPQRPWIAERTAPLGHPSPYFSGVSAFVRPLSTMQSSMRYVLLALGMLVCVLLLTWLQYSR